MGDYRTEKDSLGEIPVPADALYGPQTQRAVENFPVSGIPFSRVFIRALGLIKEAAAGVNAELGLIEPEVARAIQAASREVSEGEWDRDFPIDIFQTGSGTSSNMNANEVIASRADQILGAASGTVHPNDHVNLCQSSNDVIPAAIHVSAFLETDKVLLPALHLLRKSLLKRSEEFHNVVKTGRTHLMDAMPIRFGQEIGGWAFQVAEGVERIEGSLPRLAKLATGGTAVGTGINSHKEFGALVAARLADKTGLPFIETANHFASQSALDAATELSGHLKTLATALMKIANDLRLMNSGPLAGLGEISLPSLQPGSSIMPGKVNPVICESVMMVCAQVIGNDLTVTIGNEHGNFELNVMMPVIAHNLLQSIRILGNASNNLAEKAVRGFSLNLETLNDLVMRNPILVTALNPVIGYDKAAMIAKKAYSEGRNIKEVTAEMTDLSPAEIDRIIDPLLMTDGGIAEG